MAQPGIEYFDQEDNITISGCKLSFSVNKEIPLTDSPNNLINQTTKKKKKSTKTKTLSDGSIMVPAEDSTDGNELTMNIPYNNSYSETNNMLKNVIIQSDIMSNAINQDLSDIRASRTLKKKYDYIALLSSTSSTLLSTKVTAIRELNKSITDSHNLELKRTKELKLTQSEQDDDKKIMDMYNAFISTPIGINNLSNNFIPPSQELAFVPADSISIGDTEDLGFTNYLNNMSPEFRAMRYENSSVKTVVKYDSSTGRRWFDNVDMSTGASVPGLPVPAEMLLEDTQLDTRNGIARNTNLDKTYPLIVIGSSRLEEY